MHDIGANTQPGRLHALDEVRQRLSEATAASKCHGCGCFWNVVEAMTETDAGHGELADALANARKVVLPSEYDCLGCPVCFPALAANAFAEAFPNQAETTDLCPTEPPAGRRGWPPLPGDYHVLRYRAPVAVCTLHSADLSAHVAERSPEGVAIVGALLTENLGIERLIRNVLANPHIRVLILCGEDTQQAVGHLPGQSLFALFGQGVDERNRIRGARGKRPFLKNVTREQVEAFLRQVKPLDLIGVQDEQAILDRIRQCAAEAPGPFEGQVADRGMTALQAREPKRLVSDPAGFFVVYPDSPRGRLIVEHYTNAGFVDCVIEGSTPAAVYAVAIERKLLSRLDHAAYLGRELAAAERSMKTGEAYVQDRAPGVEHGDPVPEATACGCAPGLPCGSDAAS